MPQITIKGLTDKQMRAISTPLIPKLAEAIGCPEDWLILELAHSSFYAGGEQVPGFPIVEVSWFDRTDEVREARVAEILRDTRHGRGLPAGAGDLHHPLSGAVLRIRAGVKSKAPVR